MFFKYSDHFNRECKCLMNIYRSKKGIILAVAQQLPSSIYEGPSITNSAEYLWPTFTQSINIPSTNILMIEKYIHENKIETTDIVTNILNTPLWKRLNIVTFNKIIETSVEVSAQEARDGHTKRLSKKAYNEWRGTEKMDKFIESYGGY